MDGPLDIFLNALVSCATWDATEELVDRGLVTQLNMAIGVPVNNAVDHLTLEQALGAELGGLK